MYAQVHSAPRPPSALNPALGPAVDAVVMRGLAKDPKMRWSSCSEMVVALKSALAVAPARPAVPAAPTGTIVMAPPVPAAFAPPRPAAVAPPQTYSSIAAPPSDLPDLRYVPGQGAKVVKRRRRVPRLIVWTGVALVILVILATSGALIYLALQPAVSVSAASAHPGDQIVVTARNVPSGQTGQIEAFGTSEDFTAAGSGNVSVVFVIPAATAPGSYVVSLCWDGSCYATTSLQVLAGAVSSPSAEPSASPSPSGQGTQLTLTVVPHAGVVPGRTVLTLTGTGLAPGGASITVAQAALRQSFDALVAPNGTVTKKIVLSAQLGWARTDAFVTMCDAQYRCTPAVDITIG
jgi:hypothetical protein